MVVGYGSIGRAHGRVLDRRCGDLTVVDPEATARQAALETHPGARVVAALEAIDSLDWASAAVVVATWGPSHAALFDAVVDRGARRVVIEKPVATSVADARAMVNKATREGVALGVNYVRRYGGEVEAVADLARRFDLGPPVQVVIHGGARGLVENGIHFVEWACDLFGDDPVEVLSTARSQAINPRSPTLAFYGGTAVWSFPHGRELVMSYPLGSSVKEEAAVYYRDGVITLFPGGRARLARRSAEEVAAHPAVTWTGVAETTWEGPLAGVLAGDDRIESLLRALRDTDAGQLRPEHHERAVGACIGALVSAEVGRPIGLPLDARSEIGRRSWPIT